MQAVTVPCVRSIPELHDARHSQFAIRLKVTGFPVQVNTREANVLKRWALTCGLGMVVEAGRGRTDSGYI